MAGVVSFGDVNVDVVLAVPRLPDAGGEVFASSSSLRVGGSAANTAMAMAALGVPVQVAATVGADALGDFALRELTALGVETDLVQISHAATTGTNLVVVTPDGERTMIGARGANALHGEERRDDRDGADGRWDERAEWLHLSAYAILADPQRSAAAGAVERATAAGMGVSVDVPIGVAEEIGAGLREWLEGRDIVSLGVDAAALLGGPDRVSEAAGVVAITGGSGPVTVVAHGTRFAVHPPPSSPVDTTGAGDAFVAGLIAGRLDGLSLRSCAIMAVACGSAAARTTGGQSLLTRRSVADVVAAHEWGGIDPLDVDAVRRALTDPMA